LPLFAIQVFFSCRQLSSRLVSQKIVIATFRRRMP
jgi:hypothetical protein